MSPADANKLLAATRERIQNVKLKPMKAFKKKALPGRLALVANRG